MHGLWAALLVGLGGFVGSVARYGLAVWLNPLAGSWPLGTLAANTLGCLVIGMITGWSGAMGGLSESARLALAVGFCGGFTTLSTLMLEAEAGLRSEGVLFPVIYLLATLILAAMALAAGLLLGRVMLS